MEFLSSMPVSPRKPTMAMKPKDLPVTSRPATTPMRAKGMAQKARTGSRRVLNRLMSMRNMSSTKKGKVARTPSRASSFCSYSPAHSMV